MNHQVALYVEVYSKNKINLIDPFQNLYHQSYYENKLNFEINNQSKNQ
jgi:hypothetical protein